MSLERLASILECPRTKGSLTLKDGKFFSEEAALSYESYMGIPWLFKEPHIQLYQWQSSLKNLVFFLQSQTTLLEQQLSQPGLSPKTVTRLQLLKEALHFNAERTFEILEPLIGSGQIEKPISQDLALEKLPHTQHLNSYFHTLFRDWAWTSGESQRYSEQVVDLFNKASLSQVVVLGSGASRLTVDLHQGLCPDLTVALDINPFLFFSSKKLLSGETMELYEIPIAPLLLKDCAVKQTLKSSCSMPSNFHFLFADGINLPFKPKSLSAVVTPWYIDIISQDFALLAKKINHCLEKDGCWVNYGPLGYDNFKAKSYSKEELEDHLITSGFKIDNIEVFEMDYLASPHSSQARKEKVLGFKAIKEKDAKEPPYFHYLPQWIINGDEPIPRSEVMEQVQIRNQVAYELLNIINGKRSRNDIVPLMMNHYNMTHEMAEETLITFLINYYERRV